MYFEEQHEPLNCNVLLLLEIAFSLCQVFFPTVPQILTGKMQLTFGFVELTWKYE
jgi:hypothetical protein